MSANVPANTKRVFDKPFPLIAKAMKAAGAVNYAITANSVGAVIPTDLTEAKFRADLEVELVKVGLLPTVANANYVFVRNL